MGLDGVELVMAFEEEWDLKIPNEDSEKLITVGDAHAYILRALRERGGTPPSDEAIWSRLQAIVVEQLGVRPEQVTKSARFVQDLGVG